MTTWREGRRKVTFHDRKLKAHARSTQTQNMLFNNWTRVIMTSGCNSLHTLRQSRPEDVRAPTIEIHQHAHIHTATHTPTQRTHIVSQPLLVRSRRLGYRFSTREYCWRQKALSHQMISPHQTHLCRRWQVHQTRIRLQVRHGNATTAARSASTGCVHRLYWTYR